MTFRRSRYRTHLVIKKRRTVRTAQAVAIEALSGRSAIGWRLADIVCATMPAQLKDWRE
ncbi:protein of unknown function [Hyphomicrobium sp. MC1]|nr:protein of unknown function [Hyphomicrobium sp. MC1]